jgi:hypothetical protein
MFGHIFTGRSPVHKPRPRSRATCLFAAALAIAAATPLALPSTPASAADMPAKAPAASANSPNFHSGSQAGCN